MKKLAIVTTHPIQYNAPFFRMLHERGQIEIKIFYTWSQTEKGEKYDPGFGKNVTWDIPLTEGYPFMFSENISAEPGSHHNKGIDNPNLISEINAFAPDAVLMYGWNFKSHLRVMRYYHRKLPVLFRGDSTLLDEQPGIKKMLRRLVLKMVYRSIDIALYAGKANKDYFKAHGLKETELVFMPHAIDNNRFAPTDENVNAGKALRQKLNIPAEALVFLFAGKLEEIKQPVALAEAFFAVADENSYLIIAGSGKLKDKLTADFGGQPNIRFLDFQNQQQMPALYASCDVFVLPSLTETWGLSVNEAMAAGKAILCSDACGAAYDLVDTGANGMICKRGNIDSLKQALASFIAQPAEVKKMGERSADIISSFSYLHDCIALEDALNNFKEKH
jgi:glycosyltransferase involved in cell wall biosynthesis